MLRLKQVGAQRPVALQVGEYVPFEVALGVGPASIEDAFYWRSTGPDYLLEIKLEACSGALASLALVLVPPRSVRLVDNVLTARGLSTCGCPVMDVEPWAERLGGRETGVNPELRRIDEAISFVLSIGHDGVAVRLDTPEIATRTVWNEGVGFEFSSAGDLVGVVLVALAESDLDTLRASYGPTT